jgi:RimJ/RimL family protein N-acetyltransferase
MTTLASWRPVGDFRGIELADVVLHSERLELRPWAAADAERVAEVMADGSMHRFLALPDPYTLDSAHEYVTAIAVRPREAGTGLECAVVERAGGRIVGSAALRLGGEPEIGYWIAPEAQGRGYATETTTALTEWAFGVGLPRVLLFCEVTNTASARVALAAGFRFEGVGRNAFIGGGYGDVPERRGDLARFARLTTDPAGPVAHAFPALPGPGLTDGVIALRPVRADDGPAIAESVDEVTVRWGFTGEPKSAAEAAQSAARAGLDWLVGGVAFFAIVDVGSGRVAGTLQLRKAGPPQVGGVGYVVHPAFRGRRYATRALRLLAPWAFEVAGFARLELGAKVANEASVRAAAAAGWEPDGIRRARLRNGDGSFSDEQRFALINPKFG